MPPQAENVLILVAHSRLPDLCGPLYEGVVTTSTEYSIDRFDDTGPKLRILFDPRNKRAQNLGRLVRCL